MSATVPFDPPPSPLEGQGRAKPLPTLTAPLLIGTPYVCDLLVYTGAGTYTAEPVVAWVVQMSGVMRPIGVSQLELPDDTIRWCLRHYVSDAHKVYDVVQATVYENVPAWLATCPP